MLRPYSTNNFTLIICFSLEFKNSENPRWPPIFLYNNFLTDCCVNLKVRNKSWRNYMTTYKIWLKLVKKQESYSIFKFANYPPLSFLRYFLQENVNNFNTSTWNASKFGLRLINTIPNTFMLKYFSKYHSLRIYSLFKLEKNKKCKKRDKIPLW